MLELDNEADDTADDNADDFAELETLMLLDDKFFEELEEDSTDEDNSKLDDSMLVELSVEFTPLSSHAESPSNVSNVQVEMILFISPPKTQKGFL